jgi:protein-S-isoprenylcysteine O-methyltransferase Ste14
MLRLLSSLLVSTLLFTALIMGPAYAFTGAIDWTRGWIVVAVCCFSSALGGAYFLITDPDLVGERAKPPQPKTIADALATLFILLVVIGFCTAAVYDSRWLRLLPVSSAVSLATGLLVFTIGVAIVVWTFRVNSFATTIVEVQEARKQRVIDTGPYRFVRHPMYFGAVWYFAGVALMLESLPMALAAIIIFPVAFLGRMLVEESVLRRDLAGYADYQSRVRTRILPGIF